jgi:hypothetical protein
MATCKRVVTEIFWLATALKFRVHQSAFGVLAVLVYELWHRVDGK